MKAVLAKFSLWPPWSLNPVVVKELRQATRSWFVIGVLLIFVSVLLTFMVVYLASRSVSATAVEAIGAEAFWYLMAILGVTCGMVIPIYTGTRLALERREDNLDLLYITSLNPHRIVMGKLLSSVYLAVLLFSASLPFILLTNLLRGIDLRGIVFAVVYLFGTTCLAIELAILIGCLRVSPLFKAMLGLLALWPIAGSTLVGVASTVGRAGPMFGSMPSRDWIIFATLAALALVWLHLCSVALISPRSMNRALPLRLYSTLVWFGTGAISVYQALHLSVAHAMAPWLVFSVILLSLAAIMAVSSDDQLSLRVQARIPRNHLVRLIAFPFYSGAAQGVAWSFLLFLGTLAGGVWIYFHQFVTAPVNPSFQSLDQAFFIKILGTALYAWAYVLTGLFLHRQFLRRHTPVLAGVISFALPAALGILPVLFLFLANRLSWRIMETQQLGSLFNLLAITPEKWSHPHIMIALGWMLLSLLLNLPWFFERARAFAPPGALSEKSPA